MELEKYRKTIFEQIKHINEYGNEYWSARELSKILEYTEYNKFKNTIKKAMMACKLSGTKVNDHFAQVSEMVSIGSGAIRKIANYYLSRYACYLIVQNADPSKEVVALGQTYFAIKTRLQEITEEEYNKLSEDERRLYTRINVNNKNKLLFYRAKEAGVNDFGKFNNSGYKGLYDGETAKDIHKRKRIKEDEDILDYMNSAELGANLFRITQTEDVLKKKAIDNEKGACNIHFVVGQAIRKTIKEVGGTMPEDQPTPTKSIKEIAKETSELISVGEIK